MRKKKKINAKEIRSMSNELADYVEILIDERNDLLADLEKAEGLICSLEHDVDTLTEDVNLLESQVYMLEDDVRGQSLTIEDLEYQLENNER